MLNNAELAWSRHSEIVVERLILPQVAGAQEEFESLLATLDNDTVVEYVAKGQSFTNDDFRITCLHPTANYRADSNDYSACYLLELDGVRVLMTGDVEGDGEVALTEELKVRGIDRVDILKVAHHGSRYSTTEEFLDAVDIKLAVISSGRNNIYGHPHNETLERLSHEKCTIATTSQVGAIIVEVEGMKVYAWKR